MYCSNCGAFMSDSDKFCPSCGQPNEAEAPAKNRNSFSAGTGASDFRELCAEAVKGFWESMKNRMGIGDPDLNKGDAFEKGKSIIPECVEANEGEIPVKQYEVAKMRNRFLFIPTTQAIGRMQVTNKRVIFRAPGRCLAGRTTLQHEFAIDEIAGVEARRNYVFNVWDFIVGLFVWSIGGGIIASLSAVLFAAGFWNSHMTLELVLKFIVSLAIGVVCCIPFFTIKKRWLLKLFCLGGSYFPMLCLAVDNHMRHYPVFSKIIWFFAIIFLIICMFALFLQSIKPNLVIIIKTKLASEAIDIKRKSKITPFGREMYEQTGYSEVIPLDDAERCIREIDAIINDIQKLGNLGIEKWKTQSN